MTRRILIIGGGFGGVNTANAVAETLGSRRRVDVTLVSDRAHFLFTPLLPNAATGDVALPSISVPLHEAVHPNVDVQLDQIHTLDLLDRAAHGAYRHDYDLLVLAPGSVTSWDGHPEWEQFALPCKTGGDATRIYEHVRSAFAQAASDPDTEDVRRLLTFVIAGSGPTGVSLIAELHALIHDDLLVDSPQLADFVELILIDRRSTVLSELHESLQSICSDYLEKAGVKLLLGHTVSARTETEVVLENGDVIETRSFIWCGGVKANPLLSESGLKVNAQGRAAVDATLRAEGQHGVYVVGDAADLNTPWTAQVATQQAITAAQNVVADLSGRSHRRWEYEYQGDIITLGHNNAAVTYRGMSFEGRAARALYQMVYTALVPSNLRKLLVFRDWWAASDRKSRQGLLTASDEK